MTQNIRMGIMRWHTIPDTFFFDADYYIITFDEEGKAIDVEEDLFVPLGG